MTAEPHRLETLVKMIAVQTDPRWGRELARAEVGVGARDGLMLTSVLVPGTIPATLKALRGRFGWSMRDLAARSGVSVSTLSRAESGRPVDSTTLLALTAFVRTWWWKEEA